MENSEEFREGTDNDCRAKMRKVFHNPITHLIIIAFIVLDIAILLVVLLVDINVIQVRAETEEEEEHLREELEDGLHYAALTIISLFVVEVLLKIFIEGKHFFSDKWEMFDAIVIFVTFGLDVALAFSPVSSAVRDSVALLVFLRLWRIVKIMTEIQYCVRREVPEAIDKEKLAQEKADWLARRQAHTKKIVAHTTNTHFTLNLFTSQLVMIFLGIWIALLGVTFGTSEQLTEQLHVQNTQIRFKSRSNFDNHLRGNADKKLSSTSSPPSDHSLSHGTPTSPIQSSNHSSLSASKTPITRSSSFLLKSSSLVHLSLTASVSPLPASMTSSSSPSSSFASSTSSTTISTTDMSTKPTPLMSTPGSPVSTKLSSPFFSTTSSKIDFVTKVSTMSLKSNTTKTMSHPQTKITNPGNTHTALMTLTTSIGKTTPNDKTNPSFVTSSIPPSKQTTEPKETIAPKQTPLPKQTITSKQTTIPLSSVTSVSVKPTTDKSIQTSSTVITTITPTTWTTISKTENPKTTSQKTIPTSKQAASTSVIVQDTTSTQQPPKTTTTKHPQPTKLTTQKQMVTTKTTTKLTVTPNQESKTSTTKDTPPVKSSRTLFTSLSTKASSEGASSTLSIRTTKMESIPAKQTEKSSTTQSTSKMEPTVLTTRTTLPPSSSTDLWSTSESATSSALSTESTTFSTGRSTGRSSTSTSTQTSPSTVPSKAEPPTVSNGSKNPVVTSTTSKPSTKKTSQQTGSSTVNHMQSSSQNLTGQEHTVTVADTRSQPTTIGTLTDQSQQSSSLSKRSIGAIAAACSIIACVAIIAVVYFYVNRRYKKGGKSWEVVDEHSRIETTDLSDKMDIVLQDFDQGETKSGGETFRPVNHI